MSLLVSLRKPGLASVVCLAGLSAVPTPVVATQAAVAANWVEIAVLGQPPVQSKTGGISAAVPFANGFIYDKEAGHKVRTVEKNEISDTSFHPLTIEKVYMLADYIRHHEFWNDQVQQVFVNADGDLELIPRVGNHTIILGDVTAGQNGEKELNEKFKKLFLFYKEGLSKQGWDKYSAINLKYKDQVVCTKK